MSSPVKPQRTVTLTPLPPLGVAQTDVTNTDAQFGPDFTTGAPAKVRAAVAGARSPIDKITTLRQFYPDAQPDGKGNYIYTDLKTGKKQVFDETAFTPRDFIDAIPGGAELAGAVGGGMFGAPAGPLGAIAASGAGATGAREVSERLLRGLFGGVDTRTGGQQLVDASGTAALNAVGEGAARGVGGLLKGAGKGLGAITRTAPNAIEREVAAAGARLGVEVPKVANTRSRVLQWAGSVLRQSPLTNQMMTDAGERMVAQMGDAAQGIESALAGGQPVGKTIFNQTLRDASQGWIQRFNTTRKTLDDALLHFIPAEQRVGVPNTIEALSNLKAEVARSPELNGDRLKLAIAQLQKVVDDASGQTAAVPSAILDPTGAAAAMVNKTIRPEGVPFDVLRQTRSAVGDQVAWESPLVRKTPEERALGYAYDALKKDIGQAAKTAGKDAEAVLDMHDSYVNMARTSERLVNFDTFRKIAETTGDKNPVDWVLANADKGGAKIKSLLDNLLPPEREALVGSIFEDMGRAGNPGGADVWDMNKFAKNWEKMRTVRATVFGGPEFRQSVVPIDDLVKLVKAGQTAQQYAKYKPNVLIGFALTGAGGAGMMANPAATAGLGLSSIAAAQLLTNPKAVRLFTSLGKMGGWSASQGARLLALKKAEPGIAEAMDQYIGLLKQAGLSFPDPNQTRQLNGVGKTVTPVN